MTIIYINRARFYTSLILLYLFTWTFVYINIFNGYHSESDEYSTGMTTVSQNSLRRSLDSFEKIFQAERSFIDRVSLVISDPLQDRTGYLNIKLEHGNHIIYTGSKQLSTINPNEWFSIHLGIHVRIGEQYKLVINSKNTKSLPYMYISNDELTPVFMITYKNDLGAMDKILLVLYYLVIYIILFFLIWKYKVIFSWLKERWLILGQCRVGPYALINTFIAALVFYETKIVELGITLIYCFEILILLSSIWVENNFAKLNNKLFIKRKNKIIYLVLTLYTSFSLIGSKFLYPLNMHINFTEILCFIGMSVVVFPVVVSLTYILAYGKKTKNVQINQNMSWKTYLMCFSIIMFVSAYYIRGFNPAVSSPDTVYCIDYAIHSINGVTNWHPPFYILWLKVILKICDSIYTVILVQYLWFAFVFLEGMRLLYRRGMSSSSIILIVILTVLNCCNMLHFMTIWKDIPYAISVLWLTILIAKLVLEKNNGYFIYFELMIALLCTALMRQNGMIVFALIVPFLLYLFRNQWKMWFSCVSSILLVLFVVFPLYTYFDVQKGPVGGKYIGLGQDIMAVYYNGGNLNDTAMNIVNILSYNDLAKFKYNPFHSGSSYNLDISISEFLGAYLDTFVKNPVLMTREIINRQDGVWNLLPTRDGGYVGTMDDDPTWRSLVQRRENNFFTDRLYEYILNSVNNTILSTLEWRVGIWTLFTVLACAVCVILKNNYKFLILFSVPISHILSLAISSGWKDYRYYWPLTLVGCFLILLTLTISNKEKALGISHLR